MKLLSKDLLVKRLTQVSAYTILYIVAFIIILPVIWLLVSSIKKDTEIYSWPIHFWPNVPQWSNYIAVFTMTPFVKVAWRTFLLGITTAAISAVTSAMAGYAFARYQDVKGSKRLFQVIIVMLIVPGIVFLIPQFIVFARLNLTNTFWPWFLWAFGANAFYIFLYRQFFLGFPKELEEAAEIDGCGPFRIFWQILLPNSKPVIATVLIFGFNSIWGDYLTPSIYLSSNVTLLAVKMATAFVNPQGKTIFAVSLAATVIYVLPLVIVFFFAQKYILKGLITSGLKG